MEKSKLQKKDIFPTDTRLLIEQHIYCATTAFIAFIVTKKKMNSVQEFLIQTYKSFMLDLKKKETKYLRHNCRWGGHLELFFFVEIKVQNVFCVIIRVQKYLQQRICIKEVELIISNL